MLLNCGVREDSQESLEYQRLSNQSILKEISPEYSLEGLMLKLKLQYFGYLMWRIDSLEKTDAGKDWRQGEKGTTEDDLVGWHHRLDGHEFEQALGVGDGQGSLVCCSPRGCKAWVSTWTSFLPFFLPSKEQAFFNFMTAFTVHSDFGAPQSKICLINTLLSSENKK